jgi:hypothetical protein
MDYFVIRNKAQLSKLVELLNQRRLPFKMVLDDIYPPRSVDFNDYLWGFIYNPLAAATGHTPEEIHEICKRRFNFRHDFVYNDNKKRYELVVSAGSTTELNTKEMWDYAMKIRAEAEIELHLTLHLPNESFVRELDFKHDLIEEKRL